MIESLFDRGSNDEPATEIITADACNEFAIPVSIVTSKVPARLTKHFELKDGELQKTHGGFLTKGKVEVKTVTNLDEFGGLLTSLEPTQALVYGIPQKSPCKLTTKDLWEQSGRPSNVIPRTIEMFAWNDGAGIMMFDYDPDDGGEALNSEELVAILKDAIPGLSGANFLWFPSASSFITNSQTGNQYNGLRGQRLYMLVKDARDIPRAGVAIIESLWAAGHGYFKVSSSGSLLRRTILDATVWQTNRLDFAAGASCAAPLCQDRGLPQVMRGEEEIVDTELAIPELTPQQIEQAERNQIAARRDKETEAIEKRAAWIERRAGEIIGPEADEAASVRATAVARRALENGALAGDFTITVIENGARKTVTVSHILDNPIRYHGLHTLDPIEPGYDGGRPVGKLFLSGARSNLYSFARGGQNYSLILQAVDIELIRGRSRDAVDAVLVALRQTPYVFDLGGSLVLVERGELHPFDEHGLTHFIGGIAQFWRRTNLRNGNPARVLEDPPAKVIRQILSLGNRRQLKPLEAVVTAPTLRPDGSVLCTLGYDAETKLFLEFDPDYEFNILDVPDEIAVKAALDDLMFPFLKFPFMSPADRGILLSALLTATVRASIPTSPAFGFDAPVQGSGKTLLANCVGALAMGEAPPVYPHTGGRDDEEVRKRLFSLLRYGSRAVVWDNVIGTFDSPSLAAMLTSQNVTDRILAKSEVVSVPNNAIILLTGNNLTLFGDMARRVLICRIDPRTDKPFAREFGMDPLAYVLKNRVKLTVAALTVLRGYLANKPSKAPGSMASFEGWDNMVRQTVAWVDQDIHPKQYGDPMDAIIEAQSADPEQEILGEVLEAWSELFGDQFVTAAEVIKKLRHFDSHFLSPSKEKQLAECLREISEKAPTASRSLGTALKYRVGRIVNGRCLEKGKDPHKKVAQWRVVLI